MFGIGEMCRPAFHHTRAPGDYGALATMGCATAQPMELRRTRPNFRAVTSRFVASMR